MLNLQIRFSKSTYLVGEPIELSAEFKNESNTNYQIAGYMLNTSEEGIYLSWLTKYLCISASGDTLKTLSPTVKSGKEPILMPIPLKPNKAHLIKFVPISDLQIEVDNEWIPISRKPGKYQLQMIYQIKKENIPLALDQIWSDKLYSNFEAFEIV